MADKVDKKMGSAGRGSVVGEIGSGRVRADRAASFEKSAEALRGPRISRLRDRHLAGGFGSDTTRGPHIARALRAADVASTCTRRLAEFWVHVERREESSRWTLGMIDHTRRLSEKARVPGVMYSSRLLLGREPRTAIADVRRQSENLRKRLEAKDRGRPVRRRV